MSAFNTVISVKDEPGRGNLSVKLDLYIRVFETERERYLKTLKK